MSVQRVSEKPLKELTVTVANDVTSLGQNEVVAYSWSFFITGFIRSIPSTFGAISERNY